jgi:hypothetical protein
MKVAIIERKSFGGTCVNTGCIPTKTLIASARAAHIARRAAEYGVAIGGSIAVDMKRVKERKDAVVRSSYEGLEKWLKSTANLTVYEEHARFEGAHQLGSAMKLSKGSKFSSMSAGARRPAASRARSGEVLQRFNDDGSGLPAGASDRRRRQLHRLGLARCIAVLAVGSPSLGWHRV